MNRMNHLGLATVFALALAGCGGTMATTDLGGGDMATPAGDLAASGDGGACQPPGGMCAHAPTDYEPRICNSKGDVWPACISDDNTFHGIGMAPPGSAPRTLAFDVMGQKLWKNANPPTKQDFIDARTAYAVANGLGSRVERRQDVHYTEIPGDKKLSCSEMAVVAMYPDRCYSPSKLLPIVTDAFQKGEAQSEPRVQAARLEAALLWFFYLSPLSEIWTCSFDDIEDCDSVLGYYSAFQSRDKPAGLAAYLNALDPEVHQRVYDAILGERCWRDLDKDMPYKNMELYKRALNQTDKALLRGMALILKHRFGQLATATGEQQKAHLTFVALLGGFLDRAARVANAAKADELKAEWSKPDPTKVDAKKGQDALEVIFPCP